MKMLNQVVYSQIIAIIVINHVDEYIAADDMLVYTVYFVNNCCCTFVNNI